MPSSSQVGTAQEPRTQNSPTAAKPDDYLQQLADALFRAAQRANFCRTDRLFAWLLIFQVVAAFVVALVAGDSRLRIDPSTVAVLFLNALIVSLPVILAFVRPGEEATRHSIAAAQMVTSAVLIYVTHGRIETHFHVLVSFAFLAFYRDWRVLATASAVAVCDHFVRGLLAPASVYGTEAISQWRTVEHAAWIVLCNVFLARSCLQSVADMKATAGQHARLEIANEALRREAEERKKTADALAESEERFQLAARVTYEVMWDWDIDSGRVWMNENFKHAFGHGSYDGAIDINTWRANIHPNDYTRVMQGIKSFLGGEESVWEAEYRFRRADGSYAEILDRGQVMRDGGGRACRLVSAMTDVSQQRADEATMRAAMEAAEAANRAKSEFLANMSHEIRTPMNGIIGMTELALETQLDPVQREYVETVQRSAESLLVVINDVLDFSKIEARKLDFDHSEFNLHGVIHDVIREHSVAAHAKDVQISMQIGQAVPERVIGDGARVRQVLTNLVGNAVKFTDAGQVDVSAEVHEATGAFSSICFSIRDTGIGIQPDKHGAIFDAFVQADSSTERRHGGSGLGLAICAALVERMHGRIWVESEPGKGSTFRFIARFGTASTGTAHERSSVLHALQGKQAMLICHSVLEQKALAESLSQAGMTTHVASRTQHALDLLRRARLVKQPFDFVLFGKEAEPERAEEFARLVEESDELRQTSVVSLGKSGLTAGDCQYIRASSTVDLLDQMALCLLKKESLMKESSRVHSAPMRVLLAEDNEVNQKLALRLLEAAGHHVTVAETGHRALQCFRTDTFDLILMDVQMPGLSGYECVAEIRRLENRRGERVPILATTAHAMKGAREQCLNAGMDGYLSKPFRRDELFQAIDEVMSRREVANRSTSSPGANLPPEVIADLLVIFQETRDRMLGEIQSAIDGADPVAVARAAHSIRGALSVFEAPRSIAAAHRLEKAATDKDLFDAAQMFSELQDSLAELGAEVGTKAEAARV